MSNRRTGIRVLNACPYTDCGGSVVSSQDGNRIRPPNQALVKCSVCEGYGTKTLNGFVYPLSNPEDPNSDPLINTRA